MSTSAAGSSGRNLSQAREPKYIDTPAGRVAAISATSSGPAALAAQHQWRDGLGRPGANMIRYTSRFTVDAAAFAALRRLNQELGLSERERNPRLGYLNTSWGQSTVADTDSEFYLGELHNLFQYTAPKGYRVVRGDRFQVDLVPNEDDLAENLQRIRDARRLADWVIVSFHNHEHGITDADPSVVATEFAHRAIDAGADVFHGHGPHHDRGIEIYRGKPIFYSIGKFIYQTDTVERVERDNVLRQGLDPWEATPADFYDSHSGRESSGALVVLPRDPASRRDFVATVHLNNHGNGEVRLHPIELGAGASRATRGRPVLASPANGGEVLTLMQRLSERFGTEITVADGVGVIPLRPSADSR